MWLRRPGHPVLEIESEWNGDSVEMHIRQVQGPEASMGTVPDAYRAPLSVRVVTESGSEVHPFSLDGPGTAPQLPFGGGAALRAVRRRTTCCWRN